MKTYIILQKRHFYPGTINADRGWTVAANQNESITGSKKECIHALGKLTQGNYYLSHGEHSSPSYRIVEFGNRLHKAAKRRSEWMQ